MTHRWSGWPGAWCLDCGVEDPAEACLAIHDRLEGPCPTGEHEFDKVCPEPGSRRHDPYAVPEARQATEEA